MLIEVIAIRTEEVEAAFEGGADRIERRGGSFLQKVEPELMRGIRNLLPRE